MPLIRRGYFDVHWTFKIDETWMCFLRGFFYVVSTSNRRNFCTRCLHSIIFYHFLLLLNYSRIKLSCCNFKDIDVITDFGTIRTISFGNIAIMQINRNNDKYYFLQNNTNRDYNANITKNNTYLLQNDTNQGF